MKGLLVKQAKKVSPTSILEAAVELRFELETQISGGSLAIHLGKALDNFPEFNELPSASIPPALREQNEQLKYQATHRLSNGAYNISVGSSVLGISFVTNDSSDYPGWASFYKNAKKILLVFEKIAAVRSYNRVGVRFVNSFDNNKSFVNGLEARLIHPFSDRVDLTESSIIGFLVKAENDTTCKVQIATGANINTPGGLNNTLSLIDLDASKNSSVSPEDARKAIEDCHALDEEVFFSLIKDEYGNKVFKKIER